MSPVKENLHKGDAFYGWGETRCYECNKKAGGAILESLHKGEYGNPALTIAEIEFLRDVATSHNAELKNKHQVTVNIFSK